MKTKTITEMEFRNLCELLDKYNIPFSDGVYYDTDEEPCGLWLELKVQYIDCDFED